MMINQNEVELSFLIDRVKMYVLDYCNLEHTNLFLDIFIEDKASSIYSIYKSYMSQYSGENEGESVQIPTTQEIKSITRGDTKIEYNVASIVSDKKSNSFDLPQLLQLTDEEKHLLSNHRRLKR